RHLADLHGLAGLAVLAVAAAFGGQVDDDGAVLHAVDLRLGNQLRRRPARDGGGGDDQIGLLDVLGDDLRDLVLLFLRQLARIAALAARVDAGVDELRAQRFGLLIGFRTHVVAFDHRTEAARRGDRLQAGDALAHDQAFGRAD